MFEQYTERARRVIFYARFEAQELGAAWIDTECLLLGLLRISLPALKRFLAADASQEWFHREVASGLTESEKIPLSTDLPFSNASKGVLAYCAEEAERLGNQHIGVEHLLLRLLREEDCPAAKLPREQGADMKRIRKQLAAAPMQPASEEEQSEARAVLSRAIGLPEALARPPAAGAASGGWERKIASSATPSRRGGRSSSRDMGPLDSGHPRSKASICCWECCV